MRLFLIRHAKALKSSSSDDDRALTHLGIAQAQHLAQLFIALPSPPTTLHVSPIRRAQETAAIIAGQLHIPIITTPDLSTHAPTSAAASFLHQLIQQHFNPATSVSAAAPTQTPALVGHNPTFEMLAASLLSSTPAALHFTLHTGEALHFHLTHNAPATLLARLRLASGSD